MSESLKSAITAGASEDNIKKIAREEIKTMLFTIVSNLCKQSDGVNITYMEGEKTTVYRIEVPDDYRGRLIGAGGKTINSLRVLLAAVAGTYGFRAIIDLVL